MRLTEEQMKELMAKENVTRTWSWSKLGCFHNSKYEYYLKYIKKETEDRADSIYVVTGSLSHDILEKFYENEIEYNDMLNYFYDGWVTSYELGCLKFDRTDEGKNEKLADKYYNNMVHFFKNHDILSNPLMERFVKIKIKNNLLIGYIDAIVKEEDGSINVIDFKTSSIYKGKNLLEKSGQLCLYCLGLMQQGVPFEKLKASFNFLKYCNITYEQANGVIKVRTVERMKIGESIQNNLRMWLKKLGYNDGDIMMYCNLVLENNDINILPDDIRSKYSISDCYVEVPLTEDLISEWTEYVIKTIDDIEFREKEYDKTGSDKCFWDEEDEIKTQSFYFANLCSYSPYKHRPYQMYLDKQQPIEKNNSLFSNIGSDVDVPNITNDVKDDLSWLNDLV